MQRHPAWVITRNARRPRSRAHRDRRLGPASRLNIAPLFETLEPRLLLSTITVNSAVDNATSGDGLVTLREAIDAANFDRTTDLGHTGSGADTIIFDESLRGQTIILSQNTLTISSDLTIQGLGAADLMIDGNDATVFVVEGTYPNRVHATLTDLTITNGRTGIFNNVDELTVRGVDISNHAESGILSEGGVVTVIDSTIRDNQGFVGGGIYVTNTTLAIRGSTISGNRSTQDGGGLFAQVGQGMSGSVVIESSTFSGNTSSGWGGGAMVFDAATTIRNSTFSGNSSPDGVGALYLFNNYGATAATVANTTITDNIAGFAGAKAGEGVELTLTSTIIANTTGGGLDLRRHSNIVHASNSLIENPEVGVVNGTDSNNIYGVDPMLGTLANNGGATLTHALVDGSPAIDAGANPQGLAYDQRGEGFPRMLGPAPDIGAFETPGDPPPPGPEIAVFGNGLSIADGDSSPSTADHTDFGTATPGQSSPQRTYTVRNAGTTTLTLGTPAVPGGFVLVEGLAPSLSAGTSDTFTVALSTSTIGTFSGDILFDNNDADENPFDFRITGTVNATPEPEITVVGNDQVIADGDSTPSPDDGTDFGTLDIDDPRPSRTFVVRNDGTGSLSFGPLSVPAGFIVTEGLPSSLSPGAWDSFTVELNADAPGTFTGSITFDNGDDDESPFDFVITGTITQPPPGILTVNSAGDDVTPGDGLVTLREAIDAANFDTTTDLGDTGNGADTIIFDESLRGQGIVLVDNLFIHRDLTIEGLGSEDLSVEYDFVAFRTFPDLAEPLDVTIAGLTISGGHTAIESRDNLTLRDVRVHGAGVAFPPEFPSDNGAIRHNGGTLTLLDSTVADNAWVGLIAQNAIVMIDGSTISHNDNGGVRISGGSLTITNSQITDNQAVQGAGIYADFAEVTIVRSTVARNSASDVGGGLWFENNALVIKNSTFVANSAPNGGAGARFTAQARVTQSTFSGNVSEFGPGAAIWHYSGWVAIENSTITDNASPSSAVQPDGALALISSIVANTTGGGYDLTNGVDAYRSLIESPGPDAWINAEDSLIGIDPVLRPLADNGGPTQTHLPSADSPVIDAGADFFEFTGRSPLTSDQRGEPFVRSYALAVDMGAVERQPGDPIERPTPSAILHVNSAADNTIAGDGLVTLREAIAAANADGLTDLGEQASGLDQIEFVESLRGSTILLTAGQLDIATDMNIVGLGAGDLTLDAGQNSRIFQVSDGSPGQLIDVWLSGLTLTGGEVGPAVLSLVPATGAAILSEENLTIADAVITGNSIAAYLLAGAAISHSFGNFSLLNSTVSDNIATAIEVQSTSVKSPHAVSVWVGSSVLSDNDGAGLLVNFPEAQSAHVFVAVTDSTVSGNMGGIGHFGRGSVLVQHSAVVDNLGAGVMAIFAGYTENVVRLYESQVSRNLNGGVAAWYANVTIDRSTISEHESGFASALSLNSSAAEVRDSTIANNRSVDGGGIRSQSSDLTITRTSLSGNEATGSTSTTGESGGRGGAISFTGSSDKRLTIDSSTLSHNTARLGGGLYLSSGTAHVVNSTISGNRAWAHDGGGAYVDFGRAEFDNSTIAGNSAARSGGGIAFGQIVLRSTIVADNTSFGAPNDINASVDAEYSLIETAPSWTIRETVPGSNIIGQDPNLAPLGAYGGPTLTHALFEGSVALDGGSNPGDLAYDQRGAGFARVTGSATDIGAFEGFIAVPPPRPDGVIHVNSASDDTVTGDGLVTLREAISAANNNTTTDLGDTGTLDWDQIVFDESLRGSTITLTMGQIVIADSVKIIGLGSGDLAIDAGRHSRHFFVSDRSYPYFSPILDVWISGLTLTGGQVGVGLEGGEIVGSTTGFDQLSNAGGSIISYENLTLADTIITDSHVTSLISGGGAIAHVLGDLTIFDSEISGNSAGLGSGIYISTANENPETPVTMSVAIRNSSIAGNEMETGYASAGGGVYVSPASSPHSLPVHLSVGGSSISNNDGAGLHYLAFGSVAVIDSDISGNAGRGLLIDFTPAYSEEFPSTAQIVGTLVSNNRGGGALLDAGAYTFDGSTILGNTVSGFGGGIDLLTGPLSVRNTTISGNSATTAGGGLMMRNAAGIAAEIVASTIATNMAQSGGGIQMDAGELMVTNSTISANRATGGQGGGAFVRNGSASFYNSTIARNWANSAAGGGGLHETSSSNPLLISTILADSNAGAGAGVANDLSSGSVVSAEYSLIETMLSSTQVQELTPGTNIVGVDPSLAPLTDNGGPTLTHMLLPTSRALDTGSNPANLPQDQRGEGFVRTFGSGTDIGAFEWQGEEAPPTEPIPPAPPAPVLPEPGAVIRVNSNADVSLAGDGLVTLREAITAANDDTATDLGDIGSGFDRIVFDASLNGQTIELLLDGFGIREGVSIEGPGAAGLTIDGGGLFNIFTITDGQSADQFVAAISGLTLTGGRPAIRNYENLVLRGVTLTASAANPAVGFGGALWIAGRPSADSRGGGAWVYDSTISGNTATGGGGIAALAGATLVLDGSVVSSNLADGALARGGGVYLADADAWVTGSTFTGNRAEGATAAGGGLWQGGGTVVVQESTFEDNSVTVLSSIAFLANAFIGGGGLAVGGGRLIVQGLTTTGNSSNTYGGAVGVFGGASVEMSVSDLTGNTGLWGGAIGAWGSELSIDRSTIAGNRTAFNGVGGGLLVSSSRLSIDNSTISGNIADFYGGGLAQGFTSTTITNSTFSGNTAGAQLSASPEQRAGGAIYDYGMGRLDLLNSTVTDNKAVNGGGAIYFAPFFAPPSIGFFHSTIVANTINDQGAPDSDLGFYTDRLELHHSLVETFPQYGPVPATEPGVEPTDTNIIGLDPLLGPLADNGGPTLTHALLEASPAIEAGANLFALQWDQRGPGFPRTAREATDIGAFERPNAPPVALDDSAQMDEDTVITIQVLANDSDAEGDPLTVTLVSGPSHGSVALNGDWSFTYTPAANYNGQDSFTYRLNDGFDDSNIATVRITVLPVNDAPVAGSDSYATDEDTTLTVAAQGVLGNDSDVDGNALAASLVTGPSHGTLAFNADGSFSYAPNANFNGADSFTYRASDGAAESSVATVSLTVRPINDAPVAVDDFYSTQEDVELIVPAPGFLANDFDVDGDRLTATFVSGGDAVQHGVITINSDGHLRYTPNANFHGTVSFTYKASDGAAFSNVATVTIDVLPINDAPVARNEGYAMDEDTAVAVAAPGVLGNDSDVEGDALAAALVSGPAKGTIAFNADGSFTYAPGANFNGSDSFTYRTSDGAAMSNLATVSLTIRPINDAPGAADDSAVTDEDTAIVIPILANDSDSDGDALEVILVSGPSHGTLLVNNDGTTTYTPAANFNGDDSFTYQASDGQADSNLAMVNITVTAVNDAPEAADDSAATDEDVPVTIPVLANDSDVDDAVLEVILISGPANGTALINNDGTITYTPNANFNGADSFTYQASDGQTESNVATVNIAVNAVNDAPEAADDSAGTDEDVPVTIPVLANDSDVDDAVLEVILISGPANGTALINNDGTITYTPNAGYSGDDSFTYRASDGAADSNLATVNLAVQAVNDEPIAADESYTTDEDSTLTIGAPGVLGNDSDEEGDPLAAVLVTGPANGSVTLNADGSFTYTPAANFHGADRFTYRASDGAGLSNLATVSLTIVSINDAPPAADAGPDQRVVDTDDDGSQLVTLDGSASFDADGPIVAYHWSQAGAPLGNGPTLEAPLSVGEHTITLTVTDSDGATATDTVLITVAPPLLHYTGGGHLVLTLSGDATLVQIVDSSSAQVVAQAPVGDVRRVIVDGFDGTDDSLTVDTVHGDPVPTGGVTFNGGTSGGTDMLRVSGGSFTLTDSSLTGVYRAAITHSGLDAAHLTGSTGNDRLDGSAFTLGPLSISGGDGEDTLIGGGGDDTLTPGLGDDSLIGGPGTDRAVAAGGSFQLTKQALYGLGWDWIADIEEASLTGSAGDDNFSVVTDWPGAVTIDGGDGNDSMSGAIGDDCLIGGAGTDRISAGELSTISDTVLTGRGTDTISGFEQGFFVGTSGNDHLDASMFAGPVTIAGMDGDDTLTGTAADDRLNGGQGKDLILESGGSFTLIAPNTLSGRGTDTISDHEGVSLTGSAGDDRLDASAYALPVTLDGGAGNDTLLARSGSVLHGGDGDDTLTGFFSGSSLIGGGGTDRVVENTTSGVVTLSDTSLTQSVALTENLSGIEQASITGSQYDNTIDASAFTGRVTLDGGAGNDTLTGGSGDDQLTGGAGDDLMDGGAGVDLLAEAGESFTLTDASLIGNGSDTLAGIERASLTGGDTADVIDASAFSGLVTLSGGGGNDLLIGSSAHDLILGQAGADTLTGGLGDDTLDGGDGVDLLAEAGASFTLTNTSLAGKGSDVLISIERASLTGTGGNDRLDASAFSGSVTLDGGAGDDTLLGGSGDDLLIGGTGRDLIAGGAGNDSLYGGDGRDTLGGGAGNDLISSGAGRDKIIWSLGDDTIDGSSGTTTTKTSSSKKKTSGSRRRR